MFGLASVCRPRLGLMLGLTSAFMLRLESVPIHRIGLGFGPSQSLCLSVVEGWRSLDSGQG